MKKQHDALLAMVKTPKDLRRAQEKKVYHIPQKSAPSIVRDNHLKYLSFYQPKIFKERRNQAEFYGVVKDIDICKRVDIIPEEPLNPKAYLPYYRIQLEDFVALPNIIKSRKPRRNPFIPTTKFKLLNALEYNDLVAGTPIEEIMWRNLKEHNIEAEREYLVYVLDYNRTYLKLDFAIFCEEGNIDIECDGHTYHSTKEQVSNDKDKRNTLKTKGWSTLAFPTEKIEKNIDECICKIKDVVNRMGGIKGGNKKGSKTFPKQKNKGQLGLFD